MAPRALRRPKPKWITLVASSVAVLLAVTLVGSIGYTLHLAATIGFRDRSTEAQIRGALAGSSVQSNNLLIASVTSPDGKPCKTDTLLLVHVDPTQHRIWQLWIPPEVISTIPDHGSRALGEAHVYGGAAGTIRAVKRLTGLPISQYLEVDFAALPKAVDLVGGVWVDVPSDVAGVRAPSIGGMTPSVSAGRQLVGGAQALTLAASTPAFADPDYARMRNQALVVEALAAQLANRPMSALALVSSVAPDVHTTSGLAGLVGMATGMGSAGSGGVYSAAVIGQRHGQLVTPDAKTLATLIADMRAGRPFDLPQATLAKAAGVAAAVVSNKPASQISVTVKNGAAISGAAKQAADLLQTHGFRIMGTGNANQNVYKQTLVIYQTDPSLANLVAQYLPPGTKVVRADGLYAYKGDILVMIGSDWDLSKAPVAPIQTQ